VSSSSDGPAGAASSNVPHVPVEVLRALTSLHRPVIIAHVVPDADALGSMLGFARAWKTVDCAPKASLPGDSLSTRLAFLLEWSQTPVALLDDFRSADGFVVFDTARKPRCNVGAELKETDWATNRPVIVVDHHESSTRFGTLNWIVPGASSTAELVYHVLVAAGRTVDRVTASLLYAGLQTDTLGFSLPTTTASSLAVAAELVRCGADVGELGERLCRSHRQSEFDLLRVIYANTKRVGEGVAYSSASYEEIHEAGCTAADIDEQINVPRSLDGVRLAMLFTEGRRGKTRINFRGSGNVTVVELATEFGGGGHSQAAGAVLDCGLEETIDRVVARTTEFIKRFPPNGERK